MTPRVRGALLTAGALLLVGVLTVALLPRQLASGDTLLDGAWQAEVTAGFLSPGFEVTLGDEAVEVAGAPFPGRLTAATVTLAGETTVVLGSAPPGTDSVRLRVPGLTDREATVRRIGWQRVYAGVLRGAEPVSEAVAIGDAGEVLEVVDEVPQQASLPGG